MEEILVKINFYNIVVINLNNNNLTLAKKIFLIGKGRYYSRA